MCLPSKNWLPPLNDWKELRRQCKTERPTMGDVLCNRVAEATNKRFFGDGKVPYTLSETPPKF